MKEFYISVESLGNDIVERYIDSTGEERMRRVPYSPVMFSHCMEETKYKDIYGKYCKKNTFPTMKDARDWMRRMEDMGMEAMGMDDFKLAYISDTYGSEIVYNKKFIRIANCDIEVTASQFPDPMKAEYEIDAITHYDSVDDKFYVFDLLHSLYGSVSEWDKKLAARGFIDLAISMSYYAKMPYQGVMSPIKTWDAIIFNSLKEQDKVIPQSRSHVKQSYPGAYVKEPVPAAYRYIMSFDLTSLYPSIIRQVNISPETIVGQFKLHPLGEYINKTAPRPSDEYSCSPNGWMYRKDVDGVIPVEIAKVFYQRKEWKNKMMGAKRNQELIKKVLNDKKFGTIDKFAEVNVYEDFSDDMKAELLTYTEECLDKLMFECKHAEILGNTNQLNRKILINSLYGALGNIYFRYYDLRNASAITLFGQMAIQWIERKVNEYLNKVCGTEGHSFVVAGDTDSIYVCVDKVIEKVGLERFKETNDLVEFLNQFGKKKMEPWIDQSYREMCEYMNNKEHLMFMDREAISCPPLGSNGIGGFWKAKKRYALNVYDMEGTRYAEPHLKIMGMETQQSSTPTAVQNALEESIRRMLQEGEESLQQYYKQFESEYRELDYKVIAEVKTANNIGKYDDGAGYPDKGTPYHRVRL
ncbi:hypothetical protein vBKpnAMK6_00323 [Klebsiella phage vB_Kpn_AM_K6]